MDLRSHFVMPSNLIYLNSGTMGLTPRSVLTGMQNSKNVIEDNPAQSLFMAWSQMWPVQKALGEFLKANPKDLFLRNNVTYAMNDFLMALELPANSEILISDIEYGAIVNICRYKAELEGHQLRTMAVPARGAELQTLTEESFLQHFEKSLSSKTALVMFSHVTTGSGFVFPIEKIAHICRRRNIVFAVDGAHGAGSMPLDFSQTEVDFYGSNLHKWLMGPKGTGFGWVAPHLRPRLKPKFAGWTSYDLAPHFAVFGDGDPWTCRWMICSTHNFSDFYGIRDTLEFWQKTGPEKIFARQRELRDLTAKIVTEKTKWTCLSQPQACFRGPLLAFDLPDHLAAQGFELMYRLKNCDGIQVSMTMIQDRWALRLAPHIYNTEQEIEKAAEILARLD